jgi:GAF domain-containing protein/HAMP domain-containing protein
MTVTAQKLVTSNSKNAQFRGRLARTMILALFLFTLGPLTIMGATAYFRASNLLRTQMSNQLNGVVQGSARDFEDIFKAKQIRLASISDRPEFIESAEKVIQSNNSDVTEERANAVAVIEKFNRADGPTYFAHYMLVDLSGNIQIASQLSWEELSLADSPYFNEFSEAAHTFGTFGFVPGLEDQFFLVTAVPFEDKTGKDVGYLIGITGEEYIQNILRQMGSFNPAAKSYFALEGGEFVYIDPHTLNLTLFSPSDEQSVSLATVLPLDEDPHTAKHAETLYYENDEGVAVIAEAHWMPFLETAIVLEVPESTIFSQLNSLASFTAFLLIATLAAMGTVLYISINRFINPLLSLADTTRRFAEGDWRERSAIKRNDEIGFLANSFNLMADDLSDLYRTLESRVEERARQINTAAEVAQGIASTRNLDELLKKTVSLIYERFEYYHTGIFLLDRSGRYAVLRAAESPKADEMLGSGHRLAVGSSSVIGWVTANNEPRVVTEDSDDPAQYRNEFLPETRAEAGIPISLGDQVLGALNVQSQKINAFDAEAIATMKTLASQIAAAIQNINLADSTQVDLKELEVLYRASLQISEAKSQAEVADKVGLAMRQLSLVTSVYFSQSGQLTLVHAYNPDEPDFEITPAMQQLNFSSDDLAEALAMGPIITELGRNKSTAPDALTRLPRQLGCKTAAFIPLSSGEKIYGLLTLGSTNLQRLSPVTVQPYLNLADTITSGLERAIAEENVQRRIKELEAISRATQNISAVDNLDNLYSVLHDELRQSLGDYNFLIALYQKSTDMITVPYLYENGRVSSLASFPLGEGLISILIRTLQPLMLVENTEKRAVALGAKIVGKPAKSWLGAPLLTGNEAVGAIVIQDLEREFAFADNDLHIITALATQAAGAINNVRLLDESRRRNLQLETAAEIAKDISSALDLDELLSRAIQLIRERFNFYHAGVFLADAMNEYVVIREATGEAGAQMKRSGHKLGIGSKSVVGFVAGKGEPLVVNDTVRDATYYANPLLPDTRSEAAIPLKVGDRIVGVLDVQSTQAGAFTEEALRTMQILSDQLAIAVVNSELFAETQEHLSQHRLLHHITTSAASGSTLDEALDSAVQGLQVTLGGDRVAILLLDKQKDCLAVAASIGYSEDDTKNLVIPVGSGITGWVAAHRLPQRISNVGEDPRYIEVSSNTKSELAIPLLFRNELLGVLNIESEFSAAYDEHDEEMLGTLGGSLAAIIANARLLEQIRRQVERERLLFEVTSKIRRSTDMQTILQTTASELTKVVGARRTQIKIAPTKPNNGNPE